MGFAIKNLGFWRLTLLALGFEIFHGLLELFWPAIRISRLGPRPRGAILFMTFESILIVAALAAGVGLVSEAFESHALRDSGLLLKVVGMLALIAGFFGFGLRASTGLRVG